MSVPVFFEHMVEAMTGLAQTLREHRRLRWLVVGVLSAVALFFVLSLVASR